MKKISVLFLTSVICLIPFVSQAKSKPANYSYSFNVTSCVLPDGHYSVTATNTSTGLSGLQYFRLVSPLNTSMGEYVTFPGLAAGQSATGTTYADPAGTTLSGPWTKQAYIYTNGIAFAFLGDINLSDTPCN